MIERRYSILTTLALLPTAAYLLAKGSLLGFVYAASFIVTLCYHASVETRLKRLDHALAYAVIAANTWMAFHSARLAFPIVGLCFVFLALVAYASAKADPTRYDRSHAWWHILSGIAGFVFAYGYRG